jgi:uncharacterized protein (TIGR03083 family)
MDLIQAHGVAMTEFDRRVRQIAPDQWSLGTPCREWSVRDLVGHLVYEQLWAPELLAGCTAEPRKAVDMALELEERPAEPLPVCPRAAHKDEEGDPEM